MERTYKKIKQILDWNVKTGSVCTCNYWKCVYMHVCCVQHRTGHDAGWRIGQREGGWSMLVGGSEVTQELADRENIKGKLHVSITYGHVSYPPANPDA